MPGRRHVAARVGYCLVRNWTKGEDDVALFWAGLEVHNSKSEADELDLESKLTTLMSCEETR
jgi:hypothetical protein